jgi:hypothetical protein
MPERAAINVSADSPHQMFLGQSTCRFFFKTEASDGADRWTLGDRPPTGVIGTTVDCNSDGEGAAGMMMCSWDDERTKQTDVNFEWCHQSKANCESNQCNKGSNSEWVPFHHRGCAGGGYSPQASRFFYFFFTRVLGRKSIIVYIPYFSL